MMAFVTIYWYCCRVATFGMPLLISLLTNVPRWVSLCFTCHTVTKTTFAFNGAVLGVVCCVIACVIYWYRCHIHS